MNRLGYFSSRCLAICVRVHAGPDRRRRPRTASILAARDHGPRRPGTPAWAWPLGRRPEVPQQPEQRASRVEGVKFHRAAGPFASAWSASASQDVLLDDGGDIGVRLGVRPARVPGRATTRSSIIVRLVWTLAAPSRNPSTPGIFNVLLSTTRKPHKLADFSVTSLPRRRAICSSTARACSSPLVLSRATRDRATSFG